MGTNGQAGRLTFLWTVVLVVAGARQAVSGTRSVVASLEGPRTVVFDSSMDGCDKVDIPDAPARAFRDDQGAVHLIASHYVTRASIGSSLDTVKHDCQVVFRSKRSANPAELDDSTWLLSFYDIDGKRVAALGHMEFHGWEHPGMCAVKDFTKTCWYNVVMFHVSEDGGYHFGPARAPSAFVAGLPYRYEVNQGIEGYSVGSNIIKVGSWYYAMLRGWNWPADCVETKQPCLVRFGAAPMRTENILDPSSWRGWDGKAFNVAFAYPYGEPIDRPQDHVYKPVDHMDYVNSLNFHEASGLYIATLWNPYNHAYGEEGLYFSTSKDLVHWSKPALVVAQSRLMAEESKGRWSFMYFSLIDPRSNDPNFSTVTDEPYLYYVRTDRGHPPNTRVLFRQKIKLKWQ